MTCNCMGGERYKRPLTAQLQSTPPHSSSHIAYLFLLQTTFPNTKYHTQARMGSITTIPDRSKTTPKLFTPLQIGNMHLKHRIIMSPLTRVRCPGGLPTELVAEYYAQRATEGGLIIGEGCHPSFMVCWCPFLFEIWEVERKRC